MSGKKTIAVRVHDKYAEGNKEVQAYFLESPSPQAVLAFNLVERFGMIAGAPDGFDEVGRQKMRLLRPEEVVQRAFDCARLAFEAARGEGLLIDLPDLAEVNNDKERNELNMHERKELARLRSLYEPNAIENKGR